MPISNIEVTLSGVPNYFGPAKLVLGRSELKSGVALFLHDLTDPDEACLAIVVDRKALMTALKLIDEMEVD